MRTSHFGVFPIKERNASPVPYLLMGINRIIIIFIRYISQDYLPPAEILGPGKALDVGTIPEFLETGPVALAEVVL